MVEYEWFMVRVRVRARVSWSPSWLNVSEMSVPLERRHPITERDSVEGGGLFPHTYACKAGLSGMRFNEGGRDLGSRSGSGEPSFAYER